MAQAAKTRQKQVSAYLLSKKRAGVTRINVLDLMHDLGISPAQAERAMKALEPKGVREIRG